MMEVSRLLPPGLHCGAHLSDIIKLYMEKDDVIVLYIIYYVSMYNTLYIYTYMCIHSYVCVHIYYILNIYIIYIYINFFLNPKS